MTVNKSKPKNSSNDSWKTKEKQTNILLTDKYNLPEMEIGSPKQIDYAVSIRNHFLKGFESYNGNLSEQVKNNVLQFVTSCTDANYWIDDIQKGIQKGEDCFQRYLNNNSFQTPLIQPVQKIPEVSTTFVMFVGNKNKISLRTPDDTLDSQLADLKLTKVSDFYWEIPFLENDVERPLFISKLQSLIFDTGKPLKMDKTDTSPKQPTSADGTVTRINGKLAVICKTTEIKRAFERLGYGIVYLDETKKEEIKQLIGRYDVEIDESVSKEFS